MSISRQIDRLPTPSAVRQMKVIIASPRTLGLYQAMKILGYNSYHIYECVAVRGVTHVQLFKEAIIAQYNRLAGVKRYTRTDFDKWLCDYDCVVEIPSYMGMDMIEAYAEDPDVKFILTERPPEKWAKSLNNTAAKVATMSSQFPFSILKYFDSALYQFLALNEVIYQGLACGTKPGSPGNEQILASYYAEYIKMAKATIPADRLRVIQLEDGLGWEDICPFLGVPIPSADYPGRNEPEKFQGLVQGFITPLITAAALRLSVVAVPTVAVLGWMFVKYV
ncbi:hypothetical protein N7510_003800 [Penicillium lagena]|uniref:uncharacterized protein n=1 Tax=Penicillium lagena TaxID=94218 RepID=UPI0025412FA0|nr:uncharacterized protein N7510_003800 [Penicillium lagena]KAJ5619816.1 hypothetical protein N7510_003800 [Penicillium lagena]